MKQVRIDKRALEGARKQFCLDTCLDWQQYQENPRQRCFIQKTVYAPSVPEMDKSQKEAGGRYPAMPGARRYQGTDAFFKAILCMGQLFLCVDEQIYDWALEEFGDCEPEWFCEFENLYKIDRKLREYGRRLGDTHVYFLPELLSEQENLPRRYSETETGQQEHPFFRSVKEPFFEAKKHFSEQGLSLEWFEQEEILSFQEKNKFKRAICFSPTQPDVLAVAAVKEQGERFDQGCMAGMAGASQDGQYLWQIGIDVIPEFEGRGLGAYLVEHLKREIQSRGKIPFYGTSESHTVSQTVALKAGFVPAWTELYVKPVRPEQE